MQNMSRKAFCESLLTGSVVLLIQGCGGGGDDNAGNGPPSTCADTIANNHGHEWVVARTDLDSLVDMVYNIQGAAVHNHTVTLKVADLGLLKAGNTVNVTSSTSEFHSHAVTITCV